MGDYVASFDKDFLTENMDKCMREMTVTYLRRIAVEIQLRAIDLYTMGTALISHEDHPDCIKKGQDAMLASKKLFQISKDILGEELSPEEMKKFVKHWSSL